MCCALILFGVLDLLSSVCVNLGILPYFSFESISNPASCKERDKLLVKSC